MKEAKYKLINAILMVLAVLLLLNIFRSWRQIVLRGEMIDKTKRNLQSLSEEQNALKRQLAQVENREYIERAARDKLNLGKEGEIVLILPSISPLILPSPTPTQALSNLQKWIKAFL